VKETVGKFEQVLKENGAEIVFQNHWGLRKLAYPIQKKTSGFYHLIEFKGDSDLISRFEIELKRDERIMRFLTVALDKYAVIYNESRRNGKKEKVEVPTQNEEN
jgi:small subunit ribosomal protein S6